MSTELRVNQNQWVIATLILGSLGLATTTFLPTIVSTNKATDVPAAGDKSDLIYPSTPDSISKSLGIWSDPFEKLEEKLTFEKPTRLEGDSTPPTILNIINDQLGKDGKLLVIVKIVSGTDSVDGIESRRRHRHAVELALGSSGFSMRFPDRMTFVEAQYDYFHTSSTHTTSTIDLPLKLYNNPNGDAILVVWMRDEHLGHYPLHSIAQLTNSYMKPKHPLIDRSGLVVCGPNSSNTLSRMVDEASISKNSTGSSLHGETIDFLKQWRYGAAIFNSVCTATKSSLEPNQLFIEVSQEVKARLVHTIGVDGELTKLLHRELTLRGRALNKSNSRTILFVEASSQKYIEGLKAEFFVSDSNVVIIPYLRGVSDAISADNHIADYLDRTLADLRNSAAESVAAVGVFGTQDQDKLRIFQAAKSIFPTAAFFTTELDARYAEPKYLPACRNLLVASHYGLRCQSKWVSEDIPSFRDGYQTSTFLATLIAIRCFEHPTQTFSHKNFFVEEGNSDQQDLFDICGRSNPDSTINNIKPLLFEIGNSGPIQLSDDPLPETFSIRQPDVRPSISGNLSFLLRCFLFSFILLAITFVMRSFSSGLTARIATPSTCCYRSLSTLRISMGI